MFPLLLLVGVALGAGWLWWRDPAAPRRLGEATVPLADGSRWVLWRASRGTNHEVVMGRLPALDPWRRNQAWVRQVAGPPTERVAGQAEPDSLCLFYSRERAGGGWDEDPPWVRALVDEHGCVLEAMPSRGQSQAHGIPIGYQTLTAFPRRAEVFGVEIVSGAGANPGTVERLVVRNARPWRGTEWVPEPGPLVREVEGLRMVWTGFRGTGRSMWPGFRVEEGGEERPEWRVEELWFEDVTGNRSQSPSLCRKEPAWRLRARFGRVAEAVTDPEECWEIGGLEAPGEAEFRSLAGMRVMQGVTVAMVGVAGPGQYELEQRPAMPWQILSATHLPPEAVGQSSFSSQTSSQRGGATVATVRQARTWVALSISGLKEDQRWKVALVEAGGRHRANQGWSGLGPAFRICPIEGDALRGGLRLKFIVQRLRTAEFTVAPPPLAE